MLTAVDTLHAGQDEPTHARELDDDRVGTVLAEAAPVPAGAPVGVPVDGRPHHRGHRSPRRNRVAVLYSRRPTRSRRPVPRHHRHGRHTLPSARDRRAVPSHTQQRANGHTQHDRA
jgi:hypothetical protein